MLLVFLFMTLYLCLQSLKTFVDLVRLFIYVFLFVYISAVLNLLTSWFYLFSHNIWLLLLSYHLIWKLVSLKILLFLKDLKFQFLVLYIYISYLTYCFLLHPSSIAFVHLWWVALFPVVSLLAWLQFVIAPDRQKALSLCSRL